MSVVEWIQHGRSRLLGTWKDTEQDVIASLYKRIHEVAMALQLGLV